MYNLIYHFKSIKDLEKIKDYIAFKLKNKIVAKSLHTKINEKIDICKSYPYLMGVRKSIVTHIYDYRNIRVVNYLVFYIINEKKK